MAEPLKNSFGPDVPGLIADMIEQAHPGFDRKRFLASALDGYDDLELTPRAHQISDALAETLPAYMVPGSFVLLDAIPLTANGKIDYKSLQADV